MCKHLLVVRCVTVSRRASNNASLTRSVKYTIELLRIDIVNQAFNWRQGGVFEIPLEINVVLILWVFLIKGSNI